MKGKFHNDMKHGHGILTLPDGTRHEGQWRFDKRHGHGVYTSSKNDYEGEFVNGHRHGYGVCRFKNGNVHEGYYQNGKRHGKGTYTFASGNRLICTFEQDKIVGKGEKYFHDGGVYKGDLDSDGNPHGTGVWEYADGSRYEGEVENAMRHGEGVLTLPDGSRQVGRFEKDHYLGSEHESSSMISPEETTPDE